ncbi:MAG: hypothetical protein ABW199_06890 [Caulobacterales bacterium]
MKPSMSHMLLGAAAAITRDVIGHVNGDDYARETLGTIGAMLMLMAQEAGRTADTLVTEQNALRALFADAAALPLDPNLRARLSSASAQMGGSLKIEDLSEETAQLNALLVELHEAAEASAYDWAEALEARIWEVLKLGAECRAIYLPTL